MSKYPASDDLAHVSGGNTILKKYRGQVRGVVLSKEADGQTRAAQTTRPGAGRMGARRGRGAGRAELACPPAGSRRAGPEPAAAAPGSARFPTRSVQGKASGPTGTGCAPLLAGLGGNDHGAGPRGARCPCVSQGSRSGLRSLLPTASPGSRLLQRPSLTRGRCAPSCRDRPRLLSHRRLVVETDCMALRA